MTSALNLDAYLDRIQWGGGTAPTFATLAGLLQAHLSHIHFENLDVLLGRPIRLDLDSLQDKLIRKHRGGYCFEHGTLFAAVLERLGFQAVPHTARVVLFNPRQASPRTHMFLKVSLPEGVFIADPGLGGLAPPLPVPLKEGVRSGRSGHDQTCSTGSAGQATSCAGRRLREFRSRTRHARRFFVRSDLSCQLPL